MSQKPFVVMSVLLLNVTFLTAWTVSEIYTIHEEIWCFVPVRRTVSNLPCDLKINFVVQSQTIV